MLRILYHAALEEGATRICLCDTAGYATPEGTARLVRFAREDLLAYDGCADVQVDWHGHNDRGLALANALAAIDAGADRVHGTALGVGERCGNSAMEQLLVNLHLAGDDRDLSALPDYCATASASFDRVIPPDHPVVGGDAFRTASGIHTAAIVKAGAGHGEWLADRVYSSVPASSFGRHQHIEVGPGSGASNVEYWLTRHGFTPEPGLVALILQVARNSEQMLRDDELFDLTIFGLQHSAAA
ncbi:MAG: hypothetical protein ABIS86_15560, partial [Streptosporangiaceae bacterium]